MHKVTFLLTLACTHIVSTHAQYCIEDRFTQNAYFTDDQIVVNTNISYGLADHWYQDYPQPVLNTFDIAYPDLSIDPLEKKPLIVLAHGGGFWGGEKEEFSYHISELAKSGYIAVSINYRKGWDGDPDNCGGDPLTLSQAIYFAIQDAKACLRYLVENASVYGIDTAAIFIGGESAGAYSMLNSAYLSQAEWDSVHPGFSEAYGDFDHADNNLETTYTVKGFLNMWGGVLDTTFCSRDEMKPTISFYGTSDDVIPPYDGHVQYCNNYEHVNGSASLASMLTENMVPNVLHAHTMYGHEAYEDEYTTGNISCFVKSVLCDEVQTRTVNYEEADCDEALVSVQNFNKYFSAICPNPATDFALIHLPETLSVQPMIAVFDINGRQQNVQFTVSGNNLTMDITDLPSGIYEARVSGNGMVLTSRLVISRL